MPPGRRVTPQGATPSQAGILEASAKGNGWRRRVPPRPQQQGAGRLVRRRVRRRRIADAASRGSNGGDRIRTDDPLLAKQVLYQLSYAPRWSSFSMAAIVPRDAAHTTRPTRRLAAQCAAPAPARGRTPGSPPADRFRHCGAMPKAMGQGGLEPPTPRLSSVCSDQLSYWPPAPARTLRTAQGQAGQVLGEGCAGGAQARPSVSRGTNPATTPPARQHIRVSGERSCPGQGPGTATGMPPPAPSGTGQPRTRPAMPGRPAT